MPASTPELLQPLITALCSTIVYSLWQGALLALGVAVILLWTRNKSAALRYNLLLASLSIFAIASAYTFASSIFYFLNDPVKSKSHGRIGLSFLKINSPVSIRSTFIFDRIGSYLNAHALFVVCIWFTIVCLRSLQFALGMRGVYEFRYKQVKPAAMLWQQRVCELGNAMGIYRAIKILESGIAKAPMVIGHFKPLILLPAGMLTGLPQPEIEAILIHELAHIKRGDYLVNIFQVLLEILFFFNPAVLWVSSLVRKEREHCCDDITIATAGSKLVYINALVSSLEYVQRGPVYAMALARKKKHLLSRVKRMAFNDRKPFTGIEKSVLAACILMMVLLITVCSFNGKKKRIRITETNTVSTTDLDNKAVTVPENKDSIRIYKPGDVGNGTSIKYINSRHTAYLYKEDHVLYQLFLNDGKPYAFYINGNATPENEWSHHKMMMDKIWMLYNSEVDAAYFNKSSGDGKKVASSEIKKKPVGKPVVASVLPVQSAEKLPVAEPALPVAAAAPRNDDYNSKQIIKELLRDHIIDSQGTDLSFKLSTSEFVVNGVKQPEYIYNRYKIKYLKVAVNSEVTWWYNYSTSS